MLTIVLVILVQISLIALVIINTRLNRLRAAVTLIETESQACTEVLRREIDDLRETLGLPPVRREDEWVRENMSDRAID